MKRTLRGSIRKARKSSGFLKRMATKAGRKVIKARRAKGRYKLAMG
jgi:large subunit ribosomal protein L34